MQSYFISGFFAASDGCSYKDFNKGKIMSAFSNINYSRIPEHCREGVKRYIENGIPFGGFLQAVFSNNLMRTFEEADGINIERIKDYASFLYNEAPIQSWGSKEKMEAWIESGGLEENNNG